MEAELDKRALGILSRAAVGRRVGPGWAFEETPALRGVVGLSLGAAGKVASEAGKWLYWWLLAAGEWPEGSEVRSGLKAAGAELGFVAEQLACLPGRESTRQRVRDQVRWIELRLGEEVPAWTPGAFREPFLQHLTEPAMREAFEQVGMLLWEWAAGRAELPKLLALGVAADLRMAADYLGGVARLAEQATQDQHLAELPAELALEAAKIAQEIER
jgi:hypothetical protein